MTYPQPSCPGVEIAEPFTGGPIAGFLVVLAVEGVMALLIGAPLWWWLS